MIRKKSDVQVINIKDDKDLNHRLQRHTIWHEKARIQKRNTTQGVPKYD